MIGGLKVWNNWGPISGSPIVNVSRVQWEALVYIQWLSMVWDKIPMIWDIIDLANYSLDWHDDLTKSEHHGNSNVADTKN